jgi:hypothetical protein
VQALGTPGQLVLPVASKANHLLSVEPMYTTPFATAGGELIEPPVVALHCVSRPLTVELRAPPRRGFEARVCQIKSELRPSRQSWLAQVATPGRDAQKPLIESEWPSVSALLSELNCHSAGPWRTS